MYPHLFFFDPPFPQFLDDFHYDRPYLFFDPYLFFLRSVSLVVVREEQAQPPAVHDGQDSFVADGESNQGPHGENPAPSGGAARSSRFVSPR